MNEQESKKLSSLAYEVNWQRLLVLSVDEASSPTELAHRHERLAVCERELSDFINEHVQLTKDELSRLFADNPAYDMQLSPFQP